MFRSWYRQLFRNHAAGKGFRRRPRGFCPRLDALEDRTLPSFFTAPTFATGPDPHAAVVGDFAGNGRLDLAVVNEQANTVSVLLGNGDGTFQPRTDYVAGTDPDALTGGDFNGDGRADLAVVNLTGSVSILLGTGTGTFLPATNFTVPSGSHSVTAADFNGDGKVDLVVNHSLLLGNGDGSFQPATSLAANGEIVASGDFNGDGKPDLASAVPTGPAVESMLISLGNGDGTFQAPQAFTLDSGIPRDIVVRDFNGDGTLDLAVANNKNIATRTGFVSEPGSVSVLLGNGDGSFQPAMSQTVGYGPMSLVTADINVDGHPDLIVGNGDSETAGVLLGQGDGTFRPSATYFVGTTAATGLGFVAAGDFNGDGAPDIAGADLGAAFESNGVVSVVLNRGDGTFPAPLRTALPAGASLFQQASADFNGDGIPDRAVLAAAGQVNVELGFGDGSFGDVTALAAGPRATALAAGDFNGDGTADIAVTSSSIDPGLATLLLNAPGWDYSPYAGAVGFRVSAPATTTAGSAVAVTVTAVDAAGNPVPGFRGEVHLDSAGPAAALPGSLAATHTFTAADGGTFTFTTTVPSAVGTYMLSATAPGMTRASVPVTVAPAAASHFAVAMPASSPAGTAFAFTVTALDPFGNVATGYAGTVHFSNADPQALLPADYTFTPADAGVHPFSATLFHTAFAGIVVATDAGNASVAGSGATGVLPLAARTLTVTGFPNPATAGTVGTVTVTARDIYGNVATSYNGTVHLTSSDPRAVLSPDTALVGGVARLGVTLETAATQSITAADVANAVLTADETGIQVVPGAAASFVVTGFPATTAGAAQSFTVTAYDGYGNRATNFLGTVHFSSNDAQAALPADYAFTAADAGTHTFTAALKTAGTQAITVAQAGNGQVTGTESGITVGAAAAASFTVSGFPATTAGVAHAFTVTAWDAFGNVATGYRGTVAFASSDAQAGLPPSYAFTAADAGTHTFTATLKTAGTQSLTVQDAANAAVLGSQTGIAVTAGAAVRFVLSAPTSVTQGVGFTITVTALDAYGNVATGYRGKVHFSTTAANAGLPSDYTFTGSDNGVHVFSVTVNTLGPQTVQVTDAANSSILGSALVNVVAKTSGGGGGGGSGGGGTGGGGGSGGSGGSGSGGGSAA